MTKFSEQKKTDGSLRSRFARESVNRAVLALKQSRVEMSGTAINVPTWTGRSGEAGVFNNSMRFGKNTRLPPSHGARVDVSLSSANLARGRQRENIKRRADEAFQKLQLKHRGHLFDHATSGLVRSNQANGGPMSSTALIAKMKGRSGIGMSTSGIPDSTSINTMASKNDLTDNILLETLYKFLLEQRYASSEEIIESCGDLIKDTKEKFFFRQLLWQLATLDKNTDIWTIRPKYT